MKKFARIGVAFTAAAVIASIPSVAAAESHSAGSHYYDGKDPAATGCNRNASLIATRPIKDYETRRSVATIQIFYSWSCKANWIRVTGNPYSGPTVKFISSSLGGWNSESDRGTGSSYSMMVYAPGATHIDGYVYLSDYLPPNFSPEYYPFRAEGSFAL